MPGTGGPFDGFNESEDVTLAFRARPERPIPVFADEPAVQKWQADMWAAHQGGEEPRVFPGEEPGYLFYVNPATRGIVIELKKVEISSTSWVECANVRLGDGTNREGLVPLGMIFNPRMEKLIERAIKKLPNKE